MKSNGANAGARSVFSPVEVEALSRAAAAAPSLYNSQPWRLVADERELQIYADPGRRSPLADPENRQQIIACGAALANARLAVRRLGSEPRVLLWPDPKDADHVATVRRGQSAVASAEDRALYSQIHRRHTNREWFGLRAISPAARQSLRYLAGNEGVRLRPIGTYHERKAVTELLTAAVRKQRADLKRASEMSQWLRNESAPDGMPESVWAGVTFPVPGINEHGGSPAWERRLSDLVDAHEFFVLTTPGDDREHWLAAGQGLQLALLKATQLDLGVSFFNQIIEDPQLRPVLNEQLGGCVQMMLRIGYPTLGTQERTGRRDPEVSETEPVSGRWRRSDDYEPERF
ncbi:MAG TPA: hypothetical protein VHC49_08170 [Mycobacteriales bacterium]|nr:hypothetical protein [Mycobacteriales bacterium]